MLELTRGGQHRPNRFIDPPIDKPPVPLWQVLELTRRRAPPGQPPPPDAELEKLVDDLFKEFDANGDGVFQYDEFCEAFNVLVERLNALCERCQASWKNRAGFKGTAQRLAHTVPDGPPTASVPSSPH